MPVQRKQVVSFPVHRVGKHVKSVCFITGDVYFDHLVKVMTAVFLHCTVTLFPFVVNMYLCILWGDALTQYKLPLSS